MTSLNQESTLWTMEALEGNSVLGDIYAAFCCINVSFSINDFIMEPLPVQS